MLSQNQFIWHSLDQIPMAKSTIKNKDNHIHLPQLRIQTAFTPTSLTLPRVIDGITLHDYTHKFLKRAHFDKWPYIIPHQIPFQKQILYIQ